MMTCDKTREMLLTASPAELQARSQGELGRHLATCVGCKELALRIQEHARALDDGLAVRPRVSAIEAAQRTLDAYRATYTKNEAVRRSGLLGRTLWSAGAAAAAAAAAVAVMLLPETSAPIVQFTPSLVPHPVAATSLNENGILMTNASHTVTLVWTR